jgi:hypothetical protein
MKTKIYIIIACIIGCMSQTMVLHSQTSEVRNIDFNLINDKIVITYDIVNFKPGELFNVTVTIETASGLKTIPSTVTGDIGLGIAGGTGKKVEWDYKADNFQSTEELYVNVLAISNFINKAQEEPITKYKEIKGKRRVSIGGAIVRSIFLPGAGITAAKGGGAYWLTGILAYGCAGGAYYFNMQASDNYDKYKKELIDWNKRDKYFKDSKTQKDLSNNLGIAAAVIWGGDMLWTILAAATSRDNRLTQLDNRKWNVSYTYDPRSQTPMIGLRLKF